MDLSNVSRLRAEHVIAWGFCLPILFYFVKPTSQVEYMVQAHFASNSQFNFHKYIKRSMEDDFKMVVGIRSIFQSNMHFTITLTLGYCAKDFCFYIYFVPIFAVFLYGFFLSSFCFSMSTVNLSLSLSH
jgi:hypothetical protein